MTLSGEQTNETESNFNFFYYSAPEKLKNSYEKHVHNESTTSESSAETAGMSLLKLLQHLLVQPSGGKEALICYFKFLVYHSMVHI